MKPKYQLPWKRRKKEPGRRRRWWLLLPSKRPFLIYLSPYYLISQFEGESSQAIHQTQPQQKSVVNPFFGGDPLPAQAYLGLVVHRWHGWQSWFEGAILIEGIILKSGEDQARKKKKEKKEHFDLFNSNSTRSSRPINSRHFNLMGAKKSGRVKKKEERARVVENHKRR